MNNTQEDQQGVDTQALHTVNDATDKSIETAINSASWFFGPDPKLPLHYQITTPHEPGCGVINVGTFPNSLFARHVCKLHNDWLQFKQNKKAKKQDKLLENLKSDFALFKKGFEVLQDGWFDLNYLGVKTFWKTNEDSKNAILAYIRGNKLDAEYYLFLLWFKKHVDEFDRMLSKVSDGAKAVEILNHFSDITLFDTKSILNTRNIRNARDWYLTKREVIGKIECMESNDEEQVELPEFDGNGTCKVMGLTLMGAMYAAVDDWVERVKKMSIAEHIAACNPQKVARVFNAAAARYNEGVNGYVTEKNKADGGAWEGLMEGNKPLKLTQDVDSITIPLNKKAESKPTCMRCKSCKDGCEFYDRGFCRGVCYPTYPPKWGKCVFDRKDGEGMDYFTDAEIEAIAKGAVNADASRELAKTLLGEGAVKEADEKVKAFINDELPVEEDKVEQYEAKDEQQYDRSGAHKPLTVTKNTIKDLPQTYYVEMAVKDLVDHLHPGEKIRAVVCFRSRLMAYMPPTDNKTITIANFLGHTKSMAELYQQWRIPIGKQVEEFLSHDWWYDKKHKCWTYVCNIGCEKDPFEFMALTPVLWDNHTYLGKDKDYKEAPFKYTDG